MMRTGLHTVCDTFCVACGSILGWKYLAAFHKSQRYKEGKFILDRHRVLARTPVGHGTPQLSLPQQQHTSGDDQSDEDYSDHQEPMAM
ncbi:hypothetical protein BAE44_0025444 [Dichanthelium oligosanthes]|uniref:Protein yippee-like n=1 Tax=Dichanthelium oligosanthes TaxID=888268 RepID=A0A1E5UL39_9POAL|nr:hypothetical protein BAE44_0025444 [Dichanthelium oligosanthes]